MTQLLVIFDCDGVLVDSEPATAEIMSTYFSQYGYAIDPSEVHTLFVGGTMKSAGALAMKHGAVLPEGWFDELVGKVVARMAQGVPVIAGVADLLDRIDRAGHATAIVSNGSVAKMRASLGPSGLFDRFHGRIYSGYEHGLPKPSPDLVRMAMRQAGTDPATTVMVDDSPAGCTAGVAAGVRTFGFATEGQDAALAQVGAEVVNAMEAIGHALGV